MRKELESQLAQEFPLLYRNMGGEPQKTCMAFGVGIGDGWFHLLYDLSSKLEPLIAAMPEDEQRPVAAQVKEKFGTLRFYMDYANAEMCAHIREAEAKSAVTCERCGVPGKLRQGGWLKTLCDWCHGERERERQEMARKYGDR